MMHLDDGLLARLLDGEPGPGVGPARGHLSACTECRARLALAGRIAARVDDRLRVLDHAVPAVTAGGIAARGGGARSGRSWRWAAGVVLAAGMAGAAWAAPGSPFPALVRSLADWLSGAPRTSASAPADPVTASRPADEAGIAVKPGPDLVIVFGPSPSEGSVGVTLTEGEAAEVRGPAGAATFTVEEARVVVERRAVPAAFEVRIPRTAARVEIRSGATRILVTEGDRVTAAVPPAGGRYLLRLQ